MQLVARPEPDVLHDPSYGLIRCGRQTQRGGEFSTFQYVHAYGMKAARRFRAMMRERFGAFQRVGPIMRNVPPAFVLRYRQPK